jgi:hypothetical protein
MTGVLLALRWVDVEVHGSGLFFDDFSSEIDDFVTRSSD